MQIRLLPCHLLFFVTLFLSKKSCTGFVIGRSSRASTQIKTTSAAGISINKDDDQDQTTQTTQKLIQIFDNVFSSYACEELTYLTQDHSTRGNDGSSIFVRPPYNNDKPLSPIEHAIDSYLSAIGDTTHKVEYWSRDEYINIEAHADIDEEQLEDDNELRCPKIGHVLYLEVKDELRGPTCVFPTKRIGWDNLHDESANDDETKVDVTEVVDVVTVPAIQGRVLRFPGNAMHSVPCPAHRWLLDEKEERLLRDEEKDCQEEDGDNDDDDNYEEFFDDDEDDDEEIERAVLLFNTWPDTEPGPRGVSGDYVTGSLPEGIELSEEDSLSFFQSEEAQRLVEWEEEYGTDAEEIRCNPMDQWDGIKINSISCSKDSNNEAPQEVRVGLMGRQNRRLHPNKSVKLFGPLEGMRQALADESLPTLIQLSTAKESK